VTLVVVAVLPATDVVNVEDVRNIAAEPDATVFETAHDAVIRVVVDRLIGQCVDEGRRWFFARR
jgi:hypothetical protein